MKKIIISIIAVAALFVSGCAITSKTATEQFFVTQGATTATQIILNNKDNMKYAPDFISGAALLTQIANDNLQLTVPEITAALNAAGQTNNAMRFIGPMVVNLATSYAPGGVTNGVVLNGTVQQMMLWSAPGIVNGVPAQ